MKEIVQPEWMQKDMEKFNYGEYAYEGNIQ